jgi:hypothetical protein
MTRYRDNGQTAAVAPTPTQTDKERADNLAAAIAARGSKKKPPLYIWMPDKDGNLIKKDSAFVKKSFGTLSEAAQRALAEYVLAVQQRQPTDAARRTVWNTLIDSAVAAFKEGKKQTPWDILDTQTKSAPAIGGPVISYTAYDKFASDAVLSLAAKQAGFSQGPFAQFGEQDLADFYEKLTEAAKAGGKVRQTIVKPDGTTEIVETPGGFDANAFAKNYLWAKVNIGDPKTLPVSVINQIDSLRSVAKANGLGYLSDKELANYAVQLSKGEVDLTSLQKEFNAKAAELYPVFGDRLRANPNLTVLDLVQPYISRMAKWWDIDPSTIDLDDPDLDKFIRPDGTAGKVQMGSLADWDNYLKMHPKADEANWAIEGARDLATGFARVAGFGV